MIFWLDLLCIGILIGILIVCILFLILATLDFIRYELLLPIIKQYYTNKLIKNLEKRRIYENYHKIAYLYGIELTDEFILDEAKCRNKIAKYERKMEEIDEIMRFRNHY